MVAIEPRFGFDVSGDIAAAWPRLQAASPGPTFQLDPEHLGAWVRHLGAGHAPLLLVAREGREIVGIVPLMGRDWRRRGLLPFRSVRFLGDSNADHAPLLADAARAAQVMAAALGWLFEGGWRWEALLLDNMTADHPAAAAAGAWLAEHGVAHVATEGRYYYVDLARPWHEVAGETSRRFVRKNVNLARNRLARAGGYDVASTTRWEPGRVLAEAAPLHEARQAALGRASLLGDPRGRAFVADVIAHHTGRGRFRAYWLRHAGRTIAYMLGFEEKCSFYAWNMAFDPAFARFYPSRLLIHEILLDCHARGLAEFDFMRGEADYKPKWTTRFRPRVKLAVRNRTTVYGRALHFLESVFTRPKETAAR